MIYYDWDGSRDSFPHKLKLIHSLGLINVFLLPFFLHNLTSCKLQHVNSPSASPAIDESAVVAATFFVVTILQYLRIRILMTAFLPLKWRIGRSFRPFYGNWSRQFRLRENFSPSQMIVYSAPC